MVLFLTTSNLPTNPRLLKELDLMTKESEITVILFKLGNWSDAINQSKIKDRPHVNFIEIDVTRENKLKWALWAILEKAGRILRPLNKQNLRLNAIAHTRRSMLILLQAQKMRLKPDYIVAHNLGALYPAYKLSETHNVPFIYDIEDFDPGIIVKNGGKNYKPICETLLRKCLPSSSAMTSASPLISQYTLSLLENNQTPHQVILNSFPSKDFQSPSKKDSNILSMVWFSQIISFGRGIEQLLDAIKEVNKACINKQITLRLTLIGDLDSKFNAHVIQPFLYHLQESKVGNEVIVVNIHPPMPQEELHRELANHDVGLALEPGKDINNELAISNKIIAYAQAGLYILATDTSAQRQFMEEEIGRGLICGQNSESIAAGLQKIMKEITDIQYHSLERFNKGKSLSWEKECNKIKELWKNLGII